jgi:hypothetical protein
MDRIVNNATNNYSIVCVFVAAVTFYRAVAELQ